MESVQQQYNRAVISAIEDLYKQLIHTKEELQYYKTRLNESETRLDAIVRSYK